jgi:hypothetical protein
MKSEDISKLNMSKFIATERNFCKVIFPELDWDADAWSILKLDPSYRAIPFDLVFTVNSQPIEGRKIEQPKKKTPLPEWKRVLKLMAYAPTIYPSRLMFDLN